MGVGVKSDKRPANGIFKFLTHISGASAADSDLTNMKVTGTDAIPGKFGFIPSAKAQIERVNIIILDGTVQPSKFGGINALTSGIEVAVLNLDGTTAIDFCDGSTWKKNADLGYWGGPPDIIASGNPDGMAGIRWTLSKGFGAPMTMHSGEQYVFFIRDNLGGVTEFKAFIQGRWGQ